MNKFLSQIHEDPILFATHKPVHDCDQVISIEHILIKAYSGSRGCRSKAQSPSLLKVSVHTGRPQV